MATHSSRSPQKPLINPLRNKIMQNKPNLPIAPINITPYLTDYYEYINQPPMKLQTQNKPNLPNNPKYPVSKFPVNLNFNFFYSLLSTALCISWIFILSQLRRSPIIMFELTYKPGQED